MKIEITRDGAGSKVLNDDGTEIGGIVAITIHAEVNQPTFAKIELLKVETSTVECAEKEFIVGEHRDVVAVILKDGTKVMLGT